MIARHLSDSQLLRQRVRESGLTQARFAREVLIRSPRSVKRWAAGETALPEDVRTFLEHPRRHPWP